MADVVAGVAEGKYKRLNSLFYWYFNFRRVFRENVRFLIRFTLSFMCSNSSKCRPVEAVLILYSRPLCSALNAVSGNITNSRHYVKRVFVLKHVIAANSGTLSEM